MSLVILTGAPLILIPPWISKCGMAIDELPTSDLLG